MLLLDHEPSADEIRRIQAQANQREQLTLVDQQEQFRDCWAARAGLREDDRIAAVCADRGISPKRAHNLRRRLTLPDGIRTRVVERPAGEELSVTMGQPPRRHARDRAAAGASARTRSRSTSLVPPTFGILRTVSHGWMQKPVRPTSLSASPRSQTSSVMLGTRQTIRGSVLIGPAKLHVAAVLPADVVERRRDLAERGDLDRLRQLREHVSARAGDVLEPGDSGTAPIRAAQVEGARADRQRAPATRPSRTAAES